MTQPTTINLHPTVKNFTAIHLQFNLIDVWKVVILLMTYLVNYVF